MFFFLIKKKNSDQINEKRLHFEGIHFVLKMLHWFEILAINNEKINFDWNSIFDEIQIRLFSEFPAAKCLEIVNLSKAIKGTKKGREKKCPPQFK